MKRLFPIICVSSCLIAAHSFAGSATWNLNPSHDWNTAANWTPATVPNGPSDIATFGVSNITDLAFSATPVEVSSIVFGPGASSFNITLDPAFSSLFPHLILSGAGIINNSGVMQSLTAAATKTGGVASLIEFLNAASAGDGTLLIVAGGRKTGAFSGGIVNFYDTATAGSATIVLEGARAGIDAYGGQVTFYDSSTASNASFIVGGTSVSYGGLGGMVEFADNSSAGDADFVIEPASGAGTNGGELDFTGQATAGNATILVQGTTSGKTDTAHLSFAGTSSVGNAVVTVEGATGEQGRPGSATFDTQKIGDATFIANGGGSGGKGASISFNRAGDATLIANGGNNGGTGGHIAFNQIGAGTLVANGGTNGGGGGSIALGSAAEARAKVFGNASLTTSSLSTVGSLEGDGIVSLNSQLIVGANNLSREFSGVIQNSGTLTKSGTDTLTLSGANTYSGSTLVLSGTLRVNNTTGSGTGTGAVSVQTGSLAGQGIISGGVTIGQGSGAGASLAPGEGSSKPTILVLQSTLTFKADGSYAYKLNTRKAQADEVIANGVTIESGAQFDLTTVGSKPLTAGQVFTAISNTSTAPIAGTFANLADGATITAGVNQLQVNYAGGDGNDLTLTVVP